MLDSLRGLTLMRLHFAFRAESPLRLEGYTGSTWHGALGYALGEVSPEAFDCLYRAGAADDAPRPYALLPHACAAEIAPGGWLGFSLTLVGPATALAHAVMAGAEHMGARGIGRQRARLVLAGVGCEDADGGVAQVLGSAGVAQFQALQTVGAHELGAGWAEMPARRARLQFTTRLRMKHVNGVLDTAPPLRVLLQRLVERVSVLKALYGDGEPLPGDDVRDLLARADSISIEGNGLQWRDWERTSGRTKQQMPWGGLVGEVVYRGEIGSLLPWLALGEWLHVGAKSTFGLGHFTVLAAPR